MHTCTCNGYLIIFYFWVYTYRVYIIKLLTAQCGNSAVHCAAMEGHKEVVELLIDKYNLSATDKGDVSLSWFFFCGRLDQLLCLWFSNRMETLLWVMQRGMVTFLCCD